MSSASKPQKSLSSMASVGTPKTPRASAASVSVAQPLLDLVGRRIEARRELRHERGEALRLLGVAAAAPDVAQDRLAREAPRRRTLGRRRPCQPRERDRVERMALGRLDRDAGAIGEPVHLAEGPGALGLDLGRALVGERLEQRGEDDRPVGDAVRQAGEGLGQALERQVGVGRDRIEPEFHGLHRAASGRVASRSSRRAGRRCQISRRARSSSAPQAAISSIVRRQPSHQPVAASSAQTSMHGLSKRRRRRAHGVRPKARSDSAAL